MISTAEQKPIQARLYELQAAKASLEESIRRDYDHISELVKHIDGQKIVLGGVENEITQLQMRIDPSRAMGQKAMAAEPQNFYVDEAPSNIKRGYPE